METTYKNIVNAIKGNKTISRHLATVKNYNNGSEPRAAIEVYERNVYVWLDIDRRMFNRAIEQLETEHKDLFAWGAFTKADGGDGPYIELQLTDNAIKSLKSDREDNNGETLLWKYSTEAGDFDLELAKKDILDCSHEGVCDADCERVAKQEYIQKQLQDVSNKAMLSALAQMGVEVNDENDRKEIIETVVWDAACNMRSDIVR